MERLDGGGQMAFYRAKRGDFDLVLIEGPPHSWAPWADPAIFRYAGKHPHIVDMVETELRCGNGDDQVLIAWDEGSNMRTLLRDEHLTEGEALVVVRDVLDALLILELGFRSGNEHVSLYHGAISPRWIHIDARGHASLAGAGLGNLKPESEPGRIAEHIAFVPPECIQLHESNAAWDVFALGALLHHSVVGRGVFGDGGLPRVLNAMANHRTQLAETGLRPLIGQLTAPAHARPGLAGATKLIDEALADIDVPTFRARLGGRVSESEKTSTLP